MRNPLNELINMLTGRNWVKRDAISTKDRESLDAREAGGRFARGNIPLQHPEPKLVTAADLERERNDLTVNPIPG